MTTIEPGAGRALSFDCSICGAWAMTLILPSEEALATETQPVPRGPHWLEVSSGLGNIHLRVTDEGGAPDPDFLNRATVLAAFEDIRPEAFYAINRELVPNWCPTCAQMYCADHWRVWEVFDPDDPAWHEETRGSCPNGHERMIAD